MGNQPNHIGNTLFQITFQSWLRGLVILIKVILFNLLFGLLLYPISQINKSTQNMMVIIPLYLLLLPLITYWAASFSFLSDGRLLVAVPARTVDPQTGVVCELSENSDSLTLQK